MGTPIEEVQIKCLNCGTWFPSPINNFASFEDFERLGLIGNRVRCPSCRDLTGCNKENMRVRFRGGGGGFVGADTA